MSNSIKRRLSQRSVAINAERTRVEIRRGRKRFAKIGADAALLLGAAVKRLVEKPVKKLDAEQVR